MALARINQYSRAGRLSSQVRPPAIVSGSNVVPFPRSMTSKIGPWGPTRSPVRLQPVNPVNLLKGVPLGYAQWLLDNAIRDSVDEMTRAQDPERSLGISEAVRLLWPGYFWNCGGFGSNLGAEASPGCGGQFSISEAERQFLEDAYTATLTNHSYGEVGVWSNYVSGPDIFGDTTWVKVGSMQHNPGYPNKPEEYPWPWYVGQPSGRPYVEPVPVPVPYPRQAQFARVQTTRGVRVAGPVPVGTPVFPLPEHVREPPGPHVKEVKRTMRMPMWFASMINLLTETDDWLDAAVDAIPGGSKQLYKDMGGRHTTADKAAWVYRHWPKIDVTQFLLNAGKNQLEDYLIGKMSKAEQRQMQLLFERHGVEVVRMPTTTVGNILKGLR